MMEESFISRTGRPPGTPVEDPWLTTRRKVVNTLLLIEFSMIKKRPGDVEVFTKILSELAEFLESQKETDLQKAVLALSPAALARTSSVVTFKHINALVKTKHARFLESAAQRAKMPQ